MIYSPSNHPRVYDILLSVSECHGVTKTNGTKILVNAVIQDFPVNIHSRHCESVAMAAGLIV